jgi:hypothetical protein
MRPNTPTELIGLAAWAALALAAAGLGAGCTADGNLSPGLAKGLDRLLETALAGGAGGASDCDDPILCSEAAGAAPAAPVAAVAPAPIPAKWAGKAPLEQFSCTEGGHVIENAIIDITGDALVASGSCQIRLKKSLIRGSRAALIRDQARISVSDSRMEGLDGTAVRVEGFDAQLIAKRTEFSGTVEGNLKDNGANSFE